MTMAAPNCTCAPSLLPSFGRPCPVHGLEGARLCRERDAARAALREAQESFAIVEQAATEARTEVERLRAALDAIVHHAATVMTDDTWWVDAYQEVVAIARTAASTAKDDRA